MAKPLRSPVLGYNHNIRYHGRVFHVQSEDSGPINPRVYTHLFFGGTILVSRKQAYDAATSEDAVKLLMQQQHKQVIKDLTRGAYDEGIAAFFAARGEPAVLIDEKGASVVAAPVDESGAPSGPIVVMGSGMYPVVPAPARQPVVSATPPGGSRTQPTLRPAIVARPPDVRRSPVVMSSSADGVVVQRNIVIGVGAPAHSQSISISVPRGRSAIPFVNRDAASPSTNGTGNGTPPPRAPTPEPAVSAAAGHARTPTPDRPFSNNDLALDKSLDEVILEYLSDETDE